MCGALISASPSLALFLSIPFPEFTFWSPSSRVLTQAYSLAPGLQEVHLAPSSYPQLSCLPCTISLVYLLGSSLQLYLEAETSPYLSLSPQPQSNAQRALDTASMTKRINERYEVNFHASTGKLTHSGRHSSEQKPCLRFLCSMAPSPEMGPASEDLTELRLHSWVAHAPVCTQICIPALLSSLLLPNQGHSSGPYQKY